MCAGVGLVSPLSVYVRQISCNRGISIHKILWLVWLLSISRTELGVLGFHTYTNSGVKSNIKKNQNQTNSARLEKRVKRDESAAVLYMKTDTTLTKHILVVVFP